MEYSTDRPPRAGDAPALAQPDLAQPDLAARLGPRFRALERQRRTFSLTLTALILVIYFSFLLGMAYAPGFMARPVYGVITLGFPLGIGVIVSAVGLTGIYVWRANTTFDRLTHEIVEAQR